MKSIKKLNNNSELRIEKKENNINQLNNIQMKRIITVVIALFVINTSNAQIEKLTGPRIGITVVTTGSTADFVNSGWGFELEADEKFGETGTAFTTQFGWQWESRFGNEDGGFIGLVEWVALVGGLEKGLFLPSFSAIVGARTDEGFEFGMGPNLSLSGFGLVLAVGKNIKFGNLNVPINLVYIPGLKKVGSIDTGNNREEYNYNTGSRISLIIGFNMKK